MAAGTLHPRQYMVQSSSASVSRCSGSIFTRHRSMSKVLARAVKARGWTSCVRRRRRSSVFMTDSASCNSVRKSLDVRGDHAIDSERDGRTQVRHRRCQFAMRASRSVGESSSGNRPCLLEPCRGPGRSPSEGRQRNRRRVGAGHARMPSNAISWRSGTRMGSAMTSTVNRPVGRFAGRPRSPTPEPRVPSAPAPARVRCCPNRARW